MKPLKCFSPSLRTTLGAPRYLWLPNYHFVTQVILMSSKIKCSLTSCPPFISFTSGSFQNTLVKAPPQKLGETKAECSASHGVWLPRFWAESKRINSTGVLLKSGRENKTKHNETTAYVHEWQMNSSSFSGEWTAKADGKHPLLL